MVKGMVRHGLGHVKAGCPLGLEDLQAVAHFFEVEACELARARTAMRFAKYPVPQHERDRLFTRYRASTRPQSA